MTPNMSANSDAHSCHYHDYVHNTFVEEFRELELVVGARQLATYRPVGSAVASSVHVVSLYSNILYEVSSKQRK